MLFISEITKFLEKLTAKDILIWSLEQFQEKNIVITTSCSLPVTIDLLCREIKPSLSIPVIFIDTLHHFPETLETANQIKQHYEVDLKIYQPEGIKSREEFAQIYGQELWKRDLERFHFLTKIQPLERALKELNAEVWITGRRRDQSSTRKNLPILEEDPRGYIKINPLANWTYRDVWRYIYQHQVPYNPLHDQGYTSIGDEPLTTPTHAGESERSGRWREMGRTECGLHLYSASEQSSGYSNNSSSFPKEEKTNHLTNSNSTQVNTFL
jgi:phosphoadenosine phosphosulfate reductase